MTCAHRERQRHGAGAAAPSRRRHARRSRRCWTRSWGGAAFRRLSRSSRRGGERRRVALRSAPRPDRPADLHRRPGDRARLRRRGLGAARGRLDPALDPHRRRRRPCAARLAARPRGPPPRQQHLCAGDGRADAAARAERGGVQPGAGRRAACGHRRDRAGRRRGARGGELLPQPHPLRRAARLRPARRDLRRAARRAGARRRAACGGARGGRGAGRAARHDQPRRRVLRARVPLRRERQPGRRPRRRRRPSRTG